MSIKNLRTGIRYSESDMRIYKKFLMGAQRVFNIGITTLKLSLQDPSYPPCIYITKTGKNAAPRSSGLEAPQGPCRACCPACPIKNAMTLPHAAAEQNMKDV
jgi:hypothetical protein